MEARTGKRANDLQSTIHHDAKIDFVSLSKSKSNQTQAMILIIDEKKDLFLSSIYPENDHSEFRLKKIGSHVSSAAWNEDYDQVAAISDSRILIWYQTNTLHDDLFSMSSEGRDYPGLGKNPRIINFARAAIVVENDDGSKITVTLSPVFETIHEYLLTNKWEKALHLCRFVESPQVWAMLTALAMQNTKIEFAEAGLKACCIVDKLFHLQYIKSLKGEKVKYHRNLDWHLCTFKKTYSVSLLKTRRNKQSCANSARRTVETNAFVLDAKSIVNLNGSNNGQRLDVIYSLTIIICDHE